MANEDLQKMIAGLKATVKEEQASSKGNSGFGSLAAALEQANTEETNLDSPTEELTFDASVEESEVFKIVTDSSLTTQERSEQLLELLSSQVDDDKALRASLNVLEKITPVFQKRITASNNQQTDLQVAAEQSRSQRDSINLQDAMKDLVAERKGLFEQLDVIEDFKLQEDGVEKMLDTILMADALKDAKKEHDESLGTIKRDIQKSQSRLATLKERIEAIDGVEEDGEMVVTGELTLARNELNAQQNKWLKRQTAISAAQANVSALESELHKAKEALKVETKKLTDLKSELTEQTNVYEDFMKEYNQVRHLRSVLDNDYNFDDEIRSIRTKGRDISRSIQKRFARIMSTNETLSVQAGDMYESNRVITEYTEVIVTTLNDFADVVKTKIADSAPAEADVANDDIALSLEAIRKEEKLSAYNAHMAQVESLQHIFTNHYKSVVGMSRMFHQHRLETSRERQRLMSMEHEMTTAIEQGVTFLISRIRSKTAAAEMMALLAHNLQFKTMNAADMEDSLRSQILLEFQQSQQYKNLIKSIETERKVLNEFAVLDKEISDINRTLREGVEESARGLAKDAETAFGYKGGSEEGQTAEGGSKPAATPATEQSEEPKKVSSGPKMPKVG